MSDNPTSPYQEYFAMTGSPGAQGVKGRESYVRGVESRFGGEIEIGNFCSIGAGLIVYGACEHPSVMNKQAVSSYPFSEMGWGEYPRCGSRGKVKVGSDVWIGEDVTILDGVTIGDGAIIGAKSLVASDISPYSVVGGNPAKLIRFRFEPTQIVKLMRLKWWDWDNEKIRSALPKMVDVDEFLKQYAGDLH